MVAVKFCGLTNLEDCLAALAAGADWLGFNFYPPSPRSVTPAACRQLVADLRPALPALGRPVHLVGVFVNTAADDVLATLDACGLELAQLSGMDALEVIRGCGERAYAALRTGAGASLAEQSHALARRASPPAVLVDAGVPGHYGGTGMLANWEQAAALAEKSPIFLAGGLTPENVANAVRSVRPWGVDVASGIEIVPGKKDVAGMMAFVQAVRDSV